MAYTKYSLTPADNNAAPPNGAPEGMLPSAVNDTMRDMMSQIRDVGDGIRGGTYTMTAPVITGGSITGVALSGNTLTSPVITGGSINNTTVGATTASTGAFTTLGASSTATLNTLVSSGATLTGGSINNMAVGATTRSTGAFTTLTSNGATTFTAGTASTSTTTGTAVITGGLGVSGRINATNFDGIVGANTAAAGNFTTLGATGVSTFSAGTVSAPAITTTGDTNTGIFFPAADTIAFTEGGVESMRIDSSGNVGIGTAAPTVYAANDRVLQVSSGANGGAIRISNTATGTNGGLLNYQLGLNSYLFNTSAGFLAFGASNAEAMRIDSAGNVGIGVIPSAWSGLIGVQVKDRLAFSGFGGNSYITNNSFYGSLGFTYLTTNPTSQLRFADDIFIFANAASGTAGTAVTYTERMRIDGSGNVGIGTTSPSTQLHLQSNSATYIQITDVGDGASRIGQNGTALTFGVDGANGATERMRITSAGNVGIGTSTPTGGLLSVNSTINPGTTPAALLVNMAGTAGGTATPQYGVRVTGGAYNNSTIVYGVHSELTQQLTNQTFGGYFKASGIYNTNYGIYAECVHNDTNSTTFYYGAYIKTSTVTGTGVGGTYALRVENAGTFGAASYGIYSSTVAGATNVYPLILNHAAADIFTVKSTGTVLLSGGSSAATGTGITFPATQSASSDANTLDDYEEGTWTPAGNGVTYTTATGKYTKVGNLVTCTFQIIFPTTANGSNAQVLGLPFLANSDSAVALAKYTSGINCQLATGNSLLQFLNLTNTAFITNVTLSTQSINGFVSYQV